MPLSTANSRPMTAPRPTDLTERMEEIFRPGGLLARHLPSFEAREGQLAMARAVASVLDTDPDFPRPRAACLAVEAGTGIGKTLGYLVPAVLTGQRIVVSTGTRNLQDQILDKEIPFLKKHLDPNLRALCLKGRQNYLCLLRWGQFLTAPQMTLFGAPNEIDRLRDWAGRTTTGDRAELDWLPDLSQLWAEISATTSQCLGIHCPQLAACFITRLRQQAGSARLLIVNHHLFFSDLALRQGGYAEILPRYQGVIFDEAHHLETIASQYFGTSFSHFQLIDLGRDIDRLADELPEAHKKKAKTRSGALFGQADTFAGQFPEEQGRFALTEYLEATPSFKTAAGRLYDHLDGLGQYLSSLAALSEVWTGLANRCHDLACALAALSECTDPDMIYWYERRHKAITLSASPLDVAESLAPLYKNAASVVLASATLAAGGDFSYFLDTMGCPPDTETMTLAPPFDYQQNALIYVPPDDFPEPPSPAFAESCPALVRELITASNGRALVLFTSISAMRRAALSLAGSLPWTLLVQGDAPRGALLERFRNDTHSVLLAVASFWEGVDVPGEALSLVIIDKLPFEVPSDPVLKARIERITEAGGKPFFEFQIPRAILTLRQGVGRLIRQASDRGVLAILDVRLFSKGYGRRFRQSLPPAPVCRDLAAVKAFFHRDRT